MPLKKRKKKKQSQPQSLDVDITILEKRIRRLFQMDRNEEAIDDLILLITELRRMGNTDRADQLEMTLNQYRTEILVDNLDEPDVF